MEKGLFIVFEGLDGGGKTTIIKDIIKNNRKLIDCKKIIYHKGFLPENQLGHTLKKLESTVIFILGLVYISNFIIKPAIKKGKIFIKDRYIQSIETYIPENNKLYNKIIIRLIKPILLKPDLLVYVNVSEDERIKRLKKSLDNKYHRELIENPELIRIRDECYNELFKKSIEKKISIDTSHGKARNYAERVNKIIKTLS